MLLLAYKNCLCESNLINITVHDVLEANKHKEKNALFVTMANIRHPSFMLRK